MSRTLIPVLLVAGLAAAAGRTDLAAGPAARPPQRPSYTATAALRASDGVGIASYLYLPARRPAPAVILLHMLTRSHTDWDAVGARLAEAGITALAIDLRGHGASGGVPLDPHGGEGVGGAMLDVQAAIAFLRSRPDYATSSIGIAGASIGANLAVLAAASDAGIRSLALLSPGLDYRGLRTAAALRKYDKRPALMVVSAEDAYAVRSMRELMTAGTGPREPMTVSDGGHGTVMLWRHPQLVGTLVDWFRRTLL